MSSLRGKISEKSASILLGKEMKRERKLTKQMKAKRTELRRMLKISEGAGNKFNYDDVKASLANSKGRTKLAEKYNQLISGIPEGTSLREFLDYDEKSKFNKFVASLDKYGLAYLQEQDRPSKLQAIKDLKETIGATNVKISPRGDPDAEDVETVDIDSAVEVIPPEEVKKMMEDTKEERMRIRKETKKEMKGMGMEDKKPSTPKVTVKSVTPRPKPSTPMIDPEPAEAKPSLRGAEPREPREPDVEPELEEESKEEGILQESKEEDPVEMKVKKPTRQEATEIDKLEPLASKSDFIPPNRLGTRGKDIKELLNDIKYFFKNFSSQLTREKEFFKNVDKSNLDQVRELHNRIVGKLAPKQQDTKKKVGIVVDADSYIREQMKKILAEQTFSSLRPQDVVIDVGSRQVEGRDTKDFGDFAVKRTIDGGLAAQREAVFRYMPSENDDEVGEKGKSEKQKKKPNRLQLLNPRLNNKRTNALKANVNNPFRVPQKTIKLKYLY